MDTKLLQDIGLTEGETKVYLALLRLGLTKTGPLSREAEVSSSKVYKILDRLEKKGLVGHVIKSKTKHFKAMEPKRILDYMNEKEKQLTKKKEQIKQLIPQLEQNIKQKPTGTVYYGFKAITNLYKNILDELKAGETYYVLSAGYGIGAKGVRAFFQNYHTQRMKKKIKVKMLANYETKGNLVISTTKLSEIKYLPEYFVTNMTIVFYKNKAFIFFLTKDPVSFLFESEEAVKNFKIYFDTLWKIAKK